MQTKLLFLIPFLSLSTLANYASTGNPSWHEASTQAKPETSALFVPVNGNTYLTGGNEPIRRGKIQNWSNPETVYSTYFKVSKTGELKLAVKGKAATPGAVIQVSCLGKKFRVKLPNEEQEVAIGTLRIKEPGYVKVDISGDKKSKGEFGSISGLCLEGSAAAEPLHYVHDFEPYWGMRGPSVHMGYALPKEEIAYFYNEVTVPKGNDVIGSYYMANGFGEGYCGIQVNSETERRVLFSVWSPFDTQDPKLIPESDRIVNTQRGEGVHIGEFGNEGSGGQSYLIYPWKAGNTYRFLTKVTPDGKGNTDYTAWFYATDEGRWRLIASFRRPKTNTWYRGAHSFLENFSPTQGWITRKVLFGNQWARTSKGEWIELTDGRFTCDATGNAKVRMDYTGGSEKEYFFLQNCGFFNENTPSGTKFERKVSGKKPGTDVSLPDGI
ncbi:MAG: DUF3472 domain-containing protein [Bacteroidales bacterium]